MKWLAVILFFMSNGDIHVIPIEDERFESEEACVQTIDNCRRSELFDEALFRARQRFGDWRGTLGFTCVAEAEA